jgi:hypothetical protein
MELQRLPLPSSKLISALRTLALIDGTGGVIGALFIFSKLSNVEGFVGAYSARGETNPVGIVLAFGSLLQGITVYVLFMVIAQMAENLIAIRQSTDKVE